MSLNIRQRVGFGLVTIVVASLVLMPPLRMTLHAALSDNLVACYPLNEASGNALDSVAGAHHMTDTNTVAAATGKISGGRDFETDNSEYFTIASYAGVQFGDTDYSFQLWFKRELTGQRMELMAKDIDTPAANRDFSLIIGSDDVPHFKIDMDAGDGDVAWSAAITDTASFHHIAAGHSATSNLVWIVVDNGTIVTSGTSGAGGPAGTSSPYRIGAAAYSGFEDYFDGIIDELGIWSRDIRTDVPTLYNSGSGTSCASIMGVAATHDLTGLLGIIR